jgi:sulfatase maturation enzyme AslB (radical SAM superfamily)
VEIIIQKFPRLKHVTMSSNGISTERITSVVKGISEQCRKSKIRFSVAISLHGVGNVAEKVSQVNDAFNKVSKTIEHLRPIQERNYNSLSLNCVLMNVNLLNVYELKNWSESEGLPVSYVLGEVRERFFNLETHPTTLIGEYKKDFLIRFLRELARNKRMSNPSAFRYHSLANMMEFNRKRTNACHYAMGGAILGPYGTLYFCPHSNAIGNCRESSAKEIYYSEKSLKYKKEEILYAECKKCPPYTLNRREAEKDLLKIIKFLFFNQSK